MNRKALLTSSLLLFYLISFSSAQNHQPAPRWTPFRGSPQLNQSDVLEYQKLLNNRLLEGRRRGELKNHFQNNNHDLSRSAESRNLQPDIRWLISEAGKTYDIWIHGNQLKVYECAGVIERIHGDQVKVQVGTRTEPVRQAPYPVHPGDIIKVPKQVSADLRLQKNRDEWVFITLKPIGNSPEAVLLIRNYDETKNIAGNTEMTVDNRLRQAYRSYDQNGNNTSSPSTRFRIKTGKAGTIVEALEGYVEFTRKNGAGPTKIVRDYKAVIPADDGDETAPKKPLTIVSPNRRISRYALSLLWPGAGRMYTRSYVLESDIFEYKPRKKPYLLPSIVTRSASMLAIGGALYFHAKREEARLASVRELSNYKAGIDPQNVVDFYEQYEMKLDDANKDRRRRDKLLIIYVALGLYEAVMVGIEHHKAQQMIGEFEEIKKKLYSSRFDVGVRDDAVVVNARWHFE